MLGRSQCLRLEDEVEGLVTCTVLVLETFPRPPNTVPETVAWERLLSGSEARTVLGLKAASRLVLDSQRL